VLGTTGEPWLLSERERVDLIEACRSAVPDEVPVIAGTGYPDIEGAVRLTRDAKSAGADAALVLSLVGAEDQRAYYSAVAQAAPVPSSDSRTSSRSAAQRPSQAMLTLSARY
jgi:4-hydroxy-tetrahydrodipicolinate synthase